MTELFANIKFGDKFLTTENKTAVFLRFAENAEHKFAFFYVEDWGTVQVFRESGKEVNGDVAYDIIVPLLPSGLDEAFLKYTDTAKYPPADQYQEKLAYEAFKAGAEWMAGQFEKLYLIQ